MTSVSFLSTAHFGHTGITVPIPIWMSNPGESHIHSFHHKGYSPRQITCFDSCVTINNPERGMAGRLEGAPCTYAERTIGAMCPSCLEKIAPERLVQQGCSCGIRSCDTCLTYWAEARRQEIPSALPTCFQCREVLDLSQIREDSIPVRVRAAVAIRSTRVRKQEDFKSPANHHKLVRSQSPPYQPPLQHPLAPHSVLVPSTPNVREPNIVELGMGEVRRMNIWLMRPSSFRVQMLQRSRPVGYSELPEIMRGDNTLYVTSKVLSPKLPPEQWIVIKAEYRIPETTLTYIYFFWAHPSTTIGELGELWNGAQEEGFPQSIWGLSLPGSNSILGTPAWTFNGVQMEWGDRAGDLGIVDGSVIQILIPESSIGLRV